MGKGKLALAGMASLSLVATGCGGGGSSGGDDGDVALTFMRPGTTDVVHRIFDPMLAEFEDQNDGVTVESVDVGWDEYLQRMTTMIGSGESPDVQLAGTTYYFDFVQRGAYLPLDDYITDELREQIPDALWEAVSLDGQTYSVPASTGAYVLWFNADLFEQAGLDPADPPETQEEMVEYARIITERTGVPGIGVHGKPGSLDLYDEFMAYYGPQTGLPAWDEENCEATFLDEGGVQALQSILDVVSEGVTQPHVDAFNRADLRNAFRDGDVAMVLDTSFILSVVGDLAEGEDAALRNAPLPAGDAGRSGPIGADGWSIAATSENPDEAWELLEWLVTTENQMAHDVEYGQVPPQRDQADLEPFDAEMWQNLISAVAEGLPRPRTEYATQVMQTIETMANTVLIGQSTPEEAIAAAEQELSDISC